MVFLATQQPCIYYAQGRCAKGKQCQFSHTSAQPTAAPSPRHRTNTTVSSLTPICEFYQKGFCRFGQACKFSHRVPITQTPSLLSSTASAFNPRSTPSPITVSKTSRGAVGVTPTNPPSSTQNSPFGSCKFFAQGRCSKGDACPFPHPEGSSLALSGALPPPATIFAPCRFFLQGRCVKGDTCPFPHPAGKSVSQSTARPIDVSPSEKSLVSEVQQKTILASDRDPMRKQANGIKYTQPNATPAPFSPPEPEDASVAEEQTAEPTTTRTKLSCTVVYGPGAVIQSVTTAFESSAVLLHNLPPALSHATLIELAEPFGALKSAILTPAREAHAVPSARLEYLAPADAARAVRSLAHESALRHGSLQATARLELRAAESGTATLRSTKAKLSWFAPSVVAWAHYGELSKAKNEAARLDGASFSGRTLRASFQAPSYNQRTSFSVELKGLPLDASAMNVKRFCHAGSVTMGRPSFIVGDALKELRAMLSRHGALEAFDFVPPDPRAPKPKPKLVAFVQFADADAAARAVAALHSSHQRFLRGSPIFLELIHSVKYMLPQGQFNALRSEIDALRDALETCKLRYHDRDEHGAAVERVCVRAYGPDAQALGRLKKELEGMLKGDLVRDDEGQVVWHGNFAQPDGRGVLDALAADTQTFVRCDDRTRTIHLFGSQAARAAARTRILEKAEELSAAEHVIELDDTTFRRMVHGGFHEIQASLPVAETVFLDVVLRRLVVHGDDADVRAARTAVAQQQTPGEGAPRSSTDDTPCPVCFCDVSEPLTLSCGHTYCRSCLQHYLGSLANATGGVGPTSAACLAEVVRPDGTATPCRHGIPLETIRDLLSPGEEERLLEATFLSHIHSRAQEFKYCPTVDCQTVYRASEEDTVLRCPSCIARICAFCHVEAHEGLSCSAYKDHASGGDESFERWRKEHDVRPCPGCGTGLEKNGGCNHMHCRQCGTHLCWVCMKVFGDTDSGGGVYAHMRREHGGFM